MAWHGFVLADQSISNVLPKKKISEEFWISFMFDEKLHRRAAANIDFRCGENVGKHQHFFPSSSFWETMHTSESVKDKEIFLKGILVHPKRRPQLCVLALCILTSTGINGTLKRIY